MLPPALAPSTFTQLPCVVVLSGETSMIFQVPERYDAIIKSIILVNGSANAVKINAFIGIGGREGYLIPNETELDVAGSSSSWMILDAEIRLSEGDWIRAMARTSGVVTMLVFGDNVFTG